MPPGDLLTGTHQVELNGVLFGLDGDFTGEGFVIDVTAVTGLGVPPTKTADTPLDGQDGAFAAPDFLDVRVITLTIDVSGTSEADAMNGLAILNAAWAPARDGVNVQLHMQLNGWGHVYVIGRARGAEADLSEAGAGWIPVLCRFDAVDPTIYTP